MIQMNFLVKRYGRPYSKKQIVTAKNYRLHNAHRTDRRLCIPPFLTAIHLKDWM